MSNYTICLSNKKFIIPKRSVMVGDFGCMIKSDLDINTGRFTIRKGKLSGPNHSIITQDINTCTAFNLHSKGYNKLFHLAPEEQSTQDMENLFKREVYELEEKTGEEVKVLICGGLEYNPQNIESKKSSMLPAILGELCYKFNLYCDMISGKTPSMPMESIKILDNKITIFSELFNKIFANNAAKNNRGIIENTLNKHYADIDFNPETKLIIDV